jgi:hypothetical protein
MKAEQGDSHASGARGSRPGHPRKSNSGVHAYSRRPFFHDI